MMTIGEVFVTEFPYVYTLYFDECHQETFHNVTLSKIKELLWLSCFFSSTAGAPKLRRQRVLVFPVLSSALQFLKHKYTVV